jgi:hypothetical protein
MNPDWLEIAINSCSLKLAAVTVSHLRTLDIDNQYFSPRQWSSLLQHLTGPELESICIRGRLSISAMFKFLSRHPHIRRLRLYSCWGAHDQCVKPIQFLPEILMPNLSEIEGPPCHVRALLKCILPTSPMLTIKMASDRVMTYPQYVHAVLHSMGQCRAPVRLEIRLTFFCHLLLDQKGLKSLCAIPLPQVTSLEISFPPMSDSQIVVCLLILFPPFLHDAIMLVPLLVGLLCSVVRPYTDVMPYRSLCRFGHAPAPIKQKCSGRCTWWNHSLHKW